ncbi:MAG: hypothetical protein U0746_15655 [Gemmataceae bacterium]
MRFSPAIGFLAFLVGCQSPERVVVRPLPDDAAPMAFSEVLSRSRSLANQANEQFFLDSWAELEQSANALEQSARFLKRSSMVPAVHQPVLITRAEEMERDSKDLATAAQGKNVDRANALLRRINAAVRSFGIIN